MIEPKRKGIPGSRGEGIFKQNIFTVTVPLKTTSSVDLFWKEMPRKHFFSCLGSVTNLTMSINSEILQFDSFLFYKTLLCTPKYEFFNKSFYILAFKTKLWHDILHMNLGE